MHRFGDAVAISLVVAIIVRFIVAWAATQIEEPEAPKKRKLVRSYYRS